MSALQCHFVPSALLVASLVGCSAGDTGDQTGTETSTSTQTATDDSTSSTTDSSSDTDSTETGLTATDSTATDSTATDSTETGSTDTDSTETGGTVPFELTSTAFVEGGTVPLENECGPPNGPGDDVSPPLAWTPGPDETLSYAIVMHDLDFMNLVHWVIYDIPPEALELPSSIPFEYEPPVPAGSKQASIQGAFYGYLGPCSSGSVNTYEWTVHAMPFAELPDVDAGTTDVALAAAVESMSIAEASLSGES